ncbi:MAG: rhodanese-like domain-containing protein [Bacteroidales bacterium]|nr:rhodanese-like domain-containing protein [Bacteroidales bacterium]
MKNYFRLSMVLLAMASMLFVSCVKDDDDDDVTVENKNFATLKTYLIDNNMDISDVLASWIVSAEAIYNANTDADGTNDYYIMDIRSAAHYSAGHIENAVNSSLANIVTDAANSGGKKIAVVCYTGQTASHAVVALRLSGYPTAVVMKYGMSSWDATLDSWSTSTGDVAIGNSNWAAAPGSITPNYEFGDPVITSDKTTGAELLAEGVAKVLAGMNKVTAAEVLAAPADYFINNYWAEADVTTYGNIKGAYRISPLTLEGGEYKYLPTDGRPLVTYCWTGQTSSMMTAYLKAIGYNAKSLLFGANGMIYSNLTGHNWNTSEIKNYPLVTK